MAGQVDTASAPSVLWRRGQSLVGDIRLPFQRQTPMSSSSNISQVRKTCPKKEVVLKDGRNRSFLSSRLSSSLSRIRIDSSHRWKSSAVTDQRCRLYLQPEQPKHCITFSGDSGEIANPVSLLAMRAESTQQTLSCFEAWNRSKLTSLRNAAILLSETGPMSGKRRTQLYL